MSRPSHASQRNGSRGFAANGAVCFALLLGAGLMQLGGCPGSDETTINPFSTLVEEGLVAVPTTVPDGTPTGSGGVPIGAAFRPNLSLQISNQGTLGELSTRFVAWVSLSSVPSEFDEDDLVASMYERLAEPLELGAAVTLPAGTWVYNGSGSGPIQTVRLASASADDAGLITDTELNIDLLTPDGILFFLAPPESCDSKAFEFLNNGEVVRDPSIVTTDDGISAAPNLFPIAESPLSGIKVLRQIEGYQCDPFRPGLFLFDGAGQLAPNEYLAGDTVQIAFFAGFELPSDPGLFATVGVSSAGTQFGDFTVDFDDTDGG